MAIQIPVDWWPRVLVRDGLLRATADETACECPGCNDQLCSIDITDRPGEVLGILAKLVTHVGTCPVGRNRRCDVCKSTWDYKLPRALIVLAVCAEPGRCGVLRLPKDPLRGPVAMELLDGRMGPMTFAAMRTMPEDGRRLCLMCAGPAGVAMAHRSTGTRFSSCSSADGAMVVSDLSDMEPARVPVCARCRSPATPATPLKMCSRCRVAWYCSKDCQTAHWPTHRAACVKAAPVARQQ